MLCIAPPEKAADVATLEKNHWTTAIGANGAASIQSGAKLQVRLKMEFKGATAKAEFRPVMMAFSVLAILALIGCLQTLLAADSGSSANINATAVSSESIVFFDLTSLFNLDLNDERQRHRFWDETHLVTALEGLVNRDRPQLFIRYLKQPDDFWWEQMVQPGGWLAGRQIVRIGSLDELLARFRSFYHGAVAWDERVPSTSNLASTIAGCDDLLPLRFDPQEGSLYRRLTKVPEAMPVKERLLREDGSRLFTGTGTIPGTSVASSGSAKCDAYLWLINKYLQTGKANPLFMGYCLDAFWLKCWTASRPENNTLCNQDFVIARRGVVFDLGVWDDEAPVDDPNQRPGTDPATLRKLLRAAYDRFQGKGVIQVSGFIPWAYKYTSRRSPTWFAGGHHDGVPTEWHYAEILSCFNACMDADALSLCAMPNASFYQHYPLATRYPQNPKPTRASLTAQGLLDANGRILPKTYAAFYVGDYDSAAWLYHMLPDMWRDPARGQIPLSWAFNPNLCERFPIGMVWARERRTTNDWFVAGDSGAGYLNPGYLTPPRPQSGLPSGLPAWEQHCDGLYQQWDISLTGFVIDGFARSLSSAGLDAYSRFSPDGIVTQKILGQGVHQGMPYLQMSADLGGNPAEAARTIRQHANGSLPGFMVFRSVLKTPTWHAQVEQELHRIAGDEIKIVDLYSLLWLVREYETNVAAHPLSPYANAREVSVNPDRSNGIIIRDAQDGRFTVTQHDGVPCWLVENHTPLSYLYFALDDGFRRQAGSAFDVELDYLDTGTGDVVLDYDSNDIHAPIRGAYKSHPLIMRRADNMARWQTARFRITDARFRGSENAQSDFRFSYAGSELLVRAVRVRRVGL